MPERSHFLQLLDKVFAWKCPLLPTLSLSQYWSLWVVNLLGMVGYFLGVWLQWWESSSMGYWFGFAFLLLAWTPLDWTRVVYLVRRFGSDDDWQPVSRWRAIHLIRMGDMEVHRVFHLHGTVIRGERLK
jgi:hypothetical protein